MKKLLKFIFIKLPVAFIVLSVLWVVILRCVPVIYTPLMLKRSVEYRSDKEFKTTKKWMPLEKISPNMVKAVIASEDNRFAIHNGFDTKEISLMLKEHREKGKKIRGCSTISQQTAKNVFTSGASTFVRKGFEAYFTFLIEKIWKKERIMEVYLNVAEMGKGIYGIQAASRTYFGKDASDLTMQEAASLAACLPNPLHRTPKYMQSKNPSRVRKIVSISRSITYPDWVR